MADASKEENRGEAENKTRKKVSSVLVFSKLVNGSVRILIIIKVIIMVLFVF